MKNTLKLPILSLMLTLLSMITLGGCATLRGEKSGSGKEIAVNGPTILNARFEPGTVDLNRNLQPNQPAQVTADIKDFQSNIRDVKLQFVHVPIEVPMEKVSGTTWRAELTPRQLQMLAVSGKTMSYEARVVARNEDGQVATSSDPVQVAVKAPDLASQNTG